MCLRRNRSNPTASFRLYGRTPMRKKNGELVESGTEREVMLLTAWVQSPKGTQLTELELPSRR